MAIKTPKRPKSRSKPEPLLGIFWLINDKLEIDSAPIAEASPYGSNVTHPADHTDLWEVWQHSGRAPQFSPYEEYPRGRTIHSLRTGEVTIFADRCIIERKDIVKQIKEALHLPEITEIGTDPHYRCSKCLYGTGNEEDWDV